MPRPHRHGGFELPDDVDPWIRPLDGDRAIPVIPGPAPAQHGGGGEGGSRGGGDGPAASGAPQPLLKAPVEARRIVYLIDHSMSMGASGALKRARKEVVTSLRALPPDARFRVVAYNRAATPLLSGDWLTPDEATLAAVEQRLNELTATGLTKHVPALRQALLTRPDLLFWVTDADDLGEDAVREVTRFNNNGASIHVVELAAGRGDPRGLLARLAESNRGTHRRVAPER